MHSEIEEPCEVRSVASLACGLHTWPTDSRSTQRMNVSLRRADTDAGRDGVAQDEWKARLLGSNIILLNQSINQS